jgi:dihydrofolate reductase
MTKLRVHCFSISLDGYGAGPNQDLDNPLGVGGPALHDWMIPTRSFQELEGNGVGESGADDDFVARGFANIGAWIMGRNMFGPIRGSWPDATWKGWWGDNPPYHTRVFVLTNHPRPSVAMHGGTTFHFVKGIHAALEQAKDATNGRDVRLGGGVGTIRQYLEAGLIDEMHIAINPMLLGSGEHLFNGIKQRATITISNQTLTITDNHVGNADLQITADSDTWLGFVAKERNLIWALLRRKVRLKGSPRLLQAFAKCSRLRSLTAQRYIFKLQASGRLNK